MSNFVQIFGGTAFTLLVFAFVIGIMILVHEFGHYLVAKLLGIRVEVFSLGFGPRLFGFRRGGTDYKVSLLPLGGYVKMAGENFDEALTGAPDEFLSRPKSERFLVAVAGPAMNLLLAVVLLAAIYVIGVTVPRYLREPAVIGEVEPNSPAAEAGLVPGDQIVAIDGDRMRTWEQVELTIATSPQQRLTFTIERAAHRLKREITVGVTGEGDIGHIGVSPLIPAIVEQVEPDSPAERAGLAPGDRILKVEGPQRAAYTSPGMVELIASSEGVPLQFTVERGDEILTKEITPAKIDNKVRAGYVSQLPVIVEKYGPIDAVKRALERSVNLTLLTLDITWKLIRGKVSLRTLSGPIEIARYSGRAARAGFEALLGFMALVSLQLGIFNLFPIPILDGGVIFLLLLEGIRRKDFSLAVKERIVQAGLLFLFLLMGIVILNDLSKILVR